MKTNILDNNDNDIIIIIIAVVKYLTSLMTSFPGLVKDGSKTLRELNVTNGVKMMVVGSTMNDVMKVTPPPPGALKEEKTTLGN